MVPVRIRAEAILVASAFVAIALAGCAGGDGDAASTEGPSGPADVDDNAGTVIGLVQDDELSPVANATVAIVDAGAEAVTDSSGTFRLANVPAGAHTVFVQKLGFESIGKSVAVLAGQTTEVTITLEPLPVEEPHHETFQQTKKVDWGVRVVPFVGGIAGGDQSWDYETSDRTDVMNDMFIEMEWDGTQALAGGMRLRVEVDGEANDLDFTFCVLEGKSPLTCHTGASASEDNITMIIDNDHSDCPGDDTCEIQWRGFTGTGNTGQDADFGVMLDQEFTVYTTHFYRQIMPPGFSARPDA